MTHVPGRSWTSDDEKDGYNAQAATNEGFGSKHQDKPVKAVIGIALLVILALALSRMNPAPHDISNNPSITTGQSTGTDAR